MYIHLILVFNYKNTQWIHIKHISDSGDFPRIITIIYIALFPYLNSCSTNIIENY